MWTWPSDAVQVGTCVLPAAGSLSALGTPPPQLRDQGGRAGPHLPRALGAPPRGQHRGTSAVSSAGGGTCGEGGGRGVPTTSPAPPFSENLKGRSATRLQVSVAGWASGASRPCRSLSSSAFGSPAGFPPPEQGAWRYSGGRRLGRPFPHSGKLAAAAPPPDWALRWCDAADGTCSAGARSHWVLEDRGPTQPSSLQIEPVPGFPGGECSMSMNWDSLTWNPAVDTVLTQLNTRARVAGREVPPASSPIATLWTS